MGIRIKRNAEPFSTLARPGRQEVEPVLANSRDAELLERELRRYCRGEVNGRSFLVAGHRGAGKTTLLMQALLKCQDETLRGRLRLMPVAVPLQGPALLDREGEVRALEAPSAPPPQVSVAVHVSGAAPSPAPARPRHDEELKHRVLIQVVLGLHQAVSQLFVERFQALAEDWHRRGQSGAAELRELAARFQIELTEAPPPSRLQEFWMRAHVLEQGLLGFGASPQQGLRELVALAGLTHVHQRISGDLREQEDRRLGHSHTKERTVGMEPKLEGLLKPLGVVLPGAAVATAGVAAGQFAEAMALGLLTALAASLGLRWSGGAKLQRERKVDLTFVPDLSLKTLHRVIPSLLARLNAAGLAPVFVVDELDKVDDLDAEIYPLILSLKKLFAESSFTCLLVDRGFFERLRIREEQEQRRDPPVSPAPAALVMGGVVLRQAAHGRNFSYFSHRVFVAFRPADLHAYLARLLEVQADEGSYTQAQRDADELDLPLVRWLLLHRSQLNALALNRLLESLRGPNDRLLLPGGGVLRTEDAYRIDLTLQFAIELELAEPRYQAWIDKRPQLLQVLIDAAYYVSREWLDQDRLVRRRGRHLAVGAVAEQLDLGDSGRAAFRAYLVHRMNLHEDASSAAAPAEPGEEALSDQELDTLYELAIGVARTCAFSTDADHLRRRWERLSALAAPGSLSLPSTALYDALLLGARSILVPLNTGDPECLQFHWRYLPSGESSKTTNLHQLLSLLDPLEQTIATREAWLAHLLDKLLAGKGEEGPAPLLLLSERLRLLPTTPAWSQIVAARASVAEARQVRRGNAGLGQALSLLSEYANLLDSPLTGQALSLNLLLASWLAGLAESVAAPSEARHFSEAVLELLSEGLRFDECQLPEAVRRLAALKRELDELLQSPLVLPALDRGWLSIAQMLPLMSQARLQGRSGAELVRQPERAAAAWVAAVRRLYSVPPQPASALELVCAVCQFGPGADLGLRPAQLSLRRWTQVLLHCLRDADANERSHKGEAVPFWLLAHALERLGIRSIPTEQQQQLLRHLERVARPVDELRRHIAEHRLWQSGSAGPARVALLVCGAYESLADAWRQPPHGGLLLVATVDEALKLLEHGLAEGLQALGQPLHLAWEVAAQGDAQERKLREQLMRRLGATLELPLPRGEALEQLMLRGPDALWDSI